MHTQDLQTLMNAGKVWSAAPLSCSYTHTQQSQPKSGVGFGCAAFDEQFPHKPFALHNCHEFFSEKPPLIFFSHLAKAALELKIQPSSNSSQTPFTVWIGKDVWPTPNLLTLRMQQEGKACTHTLLRSSLFIDSKSEKEKIESVLLALRSSQTATVICALPQLSLALSRKCTLAARSSGALGLFARTLNKTPTASSFASRWKLSPHSGERKPYASSFLCELLQYKGFSPGTRSWVLEFAETGHVYESAQQTISVHLLPSMGNQPHAASDRPTKSAYFAEQKRA